MIRVIIESPYSGDVGRNTRYSKACMRDSLNRGEAPLASHLLYTQEGVLNDSVEKERALGMSAGFTWGETASICAVYIDLGLSEGMKKGIEVASRMRIPIEFRTLGDKWE